MANTDSPPRIPLIVGVVGHRDVLEKDAAVLEERFRTVMRDLASRFPSTPLAVLCGLAEGADRICARVALELNAQLLVALPLPRSEYGREFSTAGSVNEFDRMLRAAARWYELPLLQGTVTTDLYPGSAIRARHYAQLSMHIVANAQVLVALYDGNPTRLAGGTDESIRYKLEGFPEEVLHGDELLNAPELGPVFHITTRRSGSHNDTPEFEHEIRLLRPHINGAPATDDQIWGMQERLDMFNRDSIKHAAKLGDRPKKSVTGAFPAVASLTLPAHARATLDWFGCADVLADRFRRKTVAAHQRLSVMVFLWGLSGIGILLAQSSSLSLGIYFCTLVGTYASYGWARYHNFEIRYLDYRALAEALRVRIHWSIAGVVSPVADLYLRKQRSELDWIRQALRADKLLAADDLASACASSIDPDMRLRVAAAQWLQPTRAYYRGTARRDRLSDMGLRRWGNILFFFGIGLAASQVFMPFLPAGIRQYAEGSSLTNLLGVMGIAQLMGALLHTYADRSAFADHAKRYIRMDEILAVADRRLKLRIERRRFEEARELLFLVGRELLMENGDWLLAHRERPLEVPKTG